jgi:hypothetical protein
MKWQLLATVIEDPGFANRTSHVRLSVDQEPRLACSCGKMLPVVYASAEMEPPASGTACRHVRGLYDRGLLDAATVNFTALGREEFEWRYAVAKLASSAR